MPKEWLVPEKDKEKIVSAINELKLRFTFPDINIKTKSVNLTPDGHMVFEPYLSPKLWLQKDGSISTDYPLSIHQRLNSVLTNHGFDVLEASPKGVKIKSISKLAGTLSAETKMH